MGAILAEYIVGKQCSSLFRGEQFCDVSGIHSYYISNKTRTGYIAKYEAVNEILDCYSDIRSLAESECEKMAYVQVASNRKEIPVSYDLIEDYFSSKERSDEPPMRLIAKIALNDFNLIYRLINGMKKVLRRDRSKVPLDRVQQQDMQCIRWLIKQPGRNTVERAGNDQRIMAVVRYESVDTMENRVFKHFLHLCHAECTSYLRQYPIDKYHENTKVQAVKNLRALIQVALAMPEFDSISNIYNLPQPNYVLQTNPAYRTIWDLYLQLLSKTRVVESVWAHRHILVHDFIRLIYLSVQHVMNKTDGKISHEIWLSQYPDEHGRIYYSASPCYLDFSSDGHGDGCSRSFRIEESTTSIRFMEFDRERMEQTESKLKIGFIPEGYEIPLNMGDDGTNKILYVEDGKDGINIRNNESRVIVPSEHVIERMFDAVKGVCNG